MRLLIFGEVFLPPAYLPRVRYFCSYLKEKGWEIDLITETSVNQDYIPSHISVLQIDYYKHKQGIISKIEWIGKFMLNIICDYKGDYFYRESKQFLKGKKYDLAFCSSSFTFPLTTTARVAKKMNIPLFVDLRDIVEQSPDDNHYLANKPPRIVGNVITNIFKNVNINRRNKILRIATGITTVSPWHVETLSKFNPNTYLIYNGFDENIFVPENIVSDRFTLSYFGRIYNAEMRNPELLFKAVKNLSKSGVLSPENTVIKWFVDEKSKSIVKKLVADYQLENFTEFHDFVKPKDLLLEMNISSILLILCNISTKKNYFGIMTTKFFEAIGANRPILCIPDNDDNLSELIKQTNCGLVSSDSAEVEKFLTKKFSEWKKTGYNSGTLTETERMNFSRRKGAKILEKLFLDAITQN